MEDLAALGLVEECAREGLINESETSILKTKLKSLMDNVASLNEKEIVLGKKAASLTNEVLAERIAVEKLKIEDAEENQVLRKLEAARASLAHEYDATEQRDTLAKYELQEIKKVHDTLIEAIATMRQENENMVLPVIKRLQQQIADNSDQLAKATERCERELQHKKSILSTLEELESIRSQKEALVLSKTEGLVIAQNEPQRLSKWSETIENAATNLDSELQALNRKIKSVQQETEKVGDQRKEAEKLRQSIVDKLAMNKNTIEKREDDVATMQVNLENARSQHHELITTKVELNLQRKECESLARHGNDELTMAKKSYEIMKRQLKKKMGIANSVKQVLVPMEGQLKDQEVVLKAYQNELEEKKKRMVSAKAEVEMSAMQFLRIDGIENEKKLMYAQSAAEVESLDADVNEKLSEVKRQTQLASLLAAQRDIKSRDHTRIEKKDKEARHQVKIKELQIMDLTKRCNEISNRLKEFSALYEVVKNERNKFVNLIQSSTQGLSEMREKIRILLSEVEILGNESTAKDSALAKEKKAHQHAQMQRDSLRQEMNTLLAEYREKQGVVEQQIQEIDKLNVVINALEKEMLELKSRYEKAVEERNTTGVQLIDRNDELCILYERSNQQQQTLKSGELQLLKKAEELRLLRLHTEELKRQYGAARRRVPEINDNRSKIADLEEHLEKARRETDECSNQLEDPKNMERWRPLDGDDPTLEDLTTKIRFLEERLNMKREQLLERELVLEEVTKLSNELRNTAIARRDSAKILVDQLNEFQTKIRDVTRKMLSSVSELSMYQATALRLQQEKASRESSLEAAAWRAGHGAAPTDDAVKELGRSDRARQMRCLAVTQREEMKRQQLSSTLGIVKTSAEPRPSAYIPESIGIPRPYGLHAPFKPSETGTTMRHIRLPQPKQIEI